MDVANRNVIVTFVDALKCRQRVDNVGELCHHSFSHSSHVTSPVNDLTRWNLSEPGHAGLEKPLTTAGACEFLKTLPRVLPPVALPSARTSRYGDNGYGSSNRPALIVQARLRRRGPMYSRMRCSSRQGYLRCA